MALPKFEYIKAQTIEEAANLASEFGDKAFVLAGGTDIIPLLKDRVRTPDYIIDLKTALAAQPALKRLEFIPGEGLAIGALTTLREIEKSAVVKEHLPAVADAAHYVASTQIRARGTMAGNICNASPSADTAPILLAGNAVIKTVRANSAEGRDIPIDKFWVGLKKTALDPGELVKGIFIPELKSGEGSAYFKHAVRKAMDLAIIGVAAWVKMEGKTIADIRIAYGGANTTTARAKTAEDMLKGKPFSEALIEEAAKAAAAEAKPITDVRASAEYRADMVRVFTKRAVLKAIDTLKA